MKLKKLLTVLAAAVLAMALLTACGGGDTTPASTKSVGEVRDALLQANPISNPLEITADHLFLLDYLLVEEDVAEFAGVRSNDAYDAGTVLVIKAAEGKAETVKTTLDEYTQSMIAYFGNYEESADAMANVENGVLTVSGDLVVMVWASNECADPAALEGAVAAALN